MTGNSGGFVDLRVHRATESSHSDDSIWPSFTDIMMVVVMIFLMASVVFMLRNIQLGQDMELASEARSQAMMETESYVRELLILLKLLNKPKSSSA